MTVVRAVKENIQQSLVKLITVEKDSYRYWRIRIMYATIIGYAAYYIVRQNFSMAIPGISGEFGYSKTQLGWVLTAFSIVYGFGKFFNGYLSDRSNARYFMTVGLLGSAFISLSIGLGSGLVFFIVFWAFNGWFQSMGWPPCARLITHWFSPKELGTKWSLWASSHQIGAMAVALLSGFLIENFGWRSALYVPGVLALGFALFLVDRLRDTPKELGFPPVEEYKGDVHHLDPKEDERITAREVWTVVLKNRLVWYMAIANMCLYIPRMGIFHWAPTFLKEYKSVNLVVAGLQVAWFEFAGLLGGIIAGWMSDKIFQGRRGPVGALYLFFLSAALFFLWAVPAGYPFVDAVFFGLAGFLVYGPQVLAGIAVADFASKRAVGVATGVIGVVGYLGSAVSGVGIGYIVDNWGWGGGFMLFIISALIGALFFGLTWNKRSRVLDQSSAIVLQSGESNNQKK
jgi:glycerol-3-phosphate transporter